jgi:hypothetical protein
MLIWSRRRRSCGWRLHRQGAPLCSARASARLTALTTPRQMIHWRLRDYIAVPLCLGDISNDVGRVKRKLLTARQTFSDQAAGAGSHTPMSRRRRPCPRRLKSFPVSTSERSIPCVTRRCCPPNISSVTTDHDDSCELPEGRRVAYSFCRSRTIRTTSPRRHSRIQASPLGRLCWRATAELVVIDRIAQHDPQSDAEFAAHRTTSCSEPLRLQFASIKSPQGGIAPHRGNGRLAPQEPQQRVALFGELPQSPSIATRVLARDHPDVTGQRFRIDKSQRIAQEHFRRECRDGPHARMRCRRRACGRSRACALTRSSRSSMCCVK